MRFDALFLNLNKVWHEFHAVNLVDSDLFKTFLSYLLDFLKLKKIFRQLNNLMSKTKNHINVRITESIVSVILTLIWFFVFDIIIGSRSVCKLAEHAYTVTQKIKSTSSFLTACTSSTQSAIQESSAVELKEVEKKLGDLEEVLRAHQTKHAKLEAEYEILQAWRQGKVL